MRGLGKTPSSLPFLLAALLLFTGCDRRPVAAPLAADEQAEQDTVLALMGRVQEDALRQAFGQLPHLAYTRYSRTEQFNAQDQLLAFREHTVRAVPDSARPTPMQADSGGAFDFGFFQTFVSETVPALDVLDLVPYVLPDDPPYRDARHREAYRFRLLPDTLLWDLEARVLEVRARPDLGDGQPIRRVRLYVDKGSGQLAALALERIDLAMLFREESTFFVSIRPLADSLWVPASTRFQTRITMPFRGTQQFHTAATWTDYTLP